MENKLHILLCEDEESLGMLVREYLQAKGYDAELYLDGEAGYKAFMRTKFDMRCNDAQDGRLYIGTRDTYGKCRGTYHFPDSKESQG